MNCLRMGNDLIRSGGNLFAYLKLLSVCARASAKARFGTLIQHPIDYGLRVLWCKKGEQGCVNSLPRTEEAAMARFQATLPF